MKFRINNPDHEKSPYTGMGREHWLDAAQFLLEGIFSNIGDLTRPYTVREQNLRSVIQIKTAGNGKHSPPDSRPGEDAF